MIFKVVVKSCAGLVMTSAAKPDLFFRVQPDSGPNFRVQTSRVGPQDPKTGPIGSGWPLKGFKFRFNSIMYLINLNEPDLNPISSRVGPPGSNFGLSWECLTQNRWYKSPYSLFS